MVVWRTIAMLVVAVWLAACSSTPIAQDIAQSQANEIVALLADNGISAVAHKSGGGQGRYTVEVAAEHYTAAVSLLHRHGLPGEVKRSFADMVAPQGLIPNSREMEALRLDRALGVELEETLLNYPGVVAARVIVRSSFLKEGATPGVSAVIQHRAESPVNAEALSAVISRAVPGVAPERILVALEVAAPRGGGDSGVEGAVNLAGEVVRIPLVPFLFLRVPKDEYNYFVFGLVGGLLVLGIVGAIVGYWWGFYHRGKGGFEENGGEPRPLRLDRTRREIPEIEGR
jgi:type III secretory pathway lipoprotein EscJ